MARTRLLDSPKFCRRPGNNGLSWRIYMMYVYLRIKAGSLRVLREFGWMANCGVLRSVYGQIERDGMHRLNNLNKRLPQVFAGSR